MRLRRPSKPGSTTARAAVGDRPRIGSETFVAAAEVAGFALDESQIAAAGRLSALADAVSDNGVPSPAIYLWGPVGRGKTWLMDVFTRALPDGWTTRLHFHSFFRAFHDGLARHGPGRESVARSIEEVVGSARILCFDELYAHEPGDAQLFTVILAELREQRHLPMVVTSNYHPDGLLPDAEFVTTGLGMWDPVKVHHASFADGIDLIKRSFEVVSLDGGVDYRTHRAPLDAKGFAAGSYIVETASDTGSGPTTALTLGSGRTVRAARVDGDDISFMFDELCERPVSASDVAGLAARFSRWTLLEVPALMTCSPEARQRFVNFLDVMSDRDVRLTITSAFTPTDLVGEGWVPPDIARAESRLARLQLRFASGLPPPSGDLRLCPQRRPGSSVGSKDNQEDR